MSKGEMLSSLAWLLKTEKLIGPVTMKVNSHSGKMELLKGRYALSIFVLFLLNSATICMWLLGFEKIAASTNVTEIILTHIASICLTVRHFVILGSTIFNRQAVILNWNDMLDFQNKFKQLNLKCQVYNKTTLLVTLVPPILNYATSLVMYELRKADMSAFTIIYAYVIQFLTKIVVITKTFKFLTLIVMYGNYFKQLNAVQKSMLADGCAEKDLFKIKLIAMCHQELCRMTRTTAKMFSMLILESLFYCVTFLTIFLYRIIMMVRDHNPNLEMLLIFETVFILVYHILPCDLCMREANNFKSFLAAFVVADSKHSADLVRQIRILSLQLEHDYLHITAGGLIPLDVSTIFAIFSALTTYVILLVQSFEST